MFEFFGDLVGAEVFNPVRRFTDNVAANPAAALATAKGFDDILEAIRNPHAPLFAAGLCRVEVLHRSVRVPLREALYFSASSLGRDRVEAMFWHDSPFQSQPLPGRCMSVPALRL